MTLLPKSLLIPGLELACVQFACAHCVWVRIYSAATSLTLHVHEAVLQQFVNMLIRCLRLLLVFLPQWSEECLSCDWQVVSSIPTQVRNKETFT